MTFLKLGCTSFGGPIAHLGYFHRAFVANRKWLSEGQYAQLLAISQFLPGPASSQLGFAIGLQRAGWAGAIAAFVGFTLPSAILLFAFANALTYFSSPLGAAAISGLKIVAFAVVADAVWGMSNKLCTDTTKRAIALAAAILLLLFPLAWVQLGIVFLAAGIGIVACSANQKAATDTVQARYGSGVSLVLLVIFAALLFGLSFSGNHPSLASIAQAFYQAGAFVFGGGHVVLPLLEENIVGSGWLPQAKFLAGYGASQAIPGPMFAFSAYLGSLVPTEQPPIWGATTALVFMFLPGFLLMAAAIPLWQQIANNSHAVKAIAGVNAAVVGILGAALYQPIFTTGITSASDFAIGLCAFSAMAIWKKSPLWIVLGCTSAKMTLVTLGA